MNTNQTEPYDCSKIIATLLVVLAHITRMYTGEGVITPSNSSSFLHFLTDFIYSFHMQLFTAISGAVYYYSKYKKQKYKYSKTFILNKAKRLILPYFAFGILYVAPVMTGFHFTERRIFEYIFHGIILSLDSRHLWYLMMLFGIFILFGLGAHLIEKYPVLIFFLFLILSITAGHFPGYFQVNNICKFLIYFYIGFCYEKIRDRMNFHWSLCIISFILLSALNYTLWIGINVYLIRFLAAVSGMVFVYTLSGLFCRPSITSSRLYTLLRRNSFGIYLFHPMIIYILFFFTGQMNIPPLLLTLISFVVSLLASVLFSSALRFFKLKILLGE